MFRDDGSHININETIDVTVFERWRAEPNYRPANLSRVGTAQEG